MKSQGQTLLNMKRLFKELSKEKGIPLENFIEPLEELYNRCSDFVYDDSVEFLKYLRHNGDKLYILTWGDKEFQKEKIISSKLDQFVDGIIYAEQLKYTLDNVDYKNGIFIDDSIRDLEGIYNRNAKKVIRIKRKNGKNSQKEMNIKGIPKFESLKELQESIDNCIMT